MACGDRYGNVVTCVVVENHASRYVAVFQDPELAKLTYR
jgi:hypothetical protein